MWQSFQDQTGFKRLGQDKAEAALLGAAVQETTRQISSSAGWGTAGQGGRVAAGPQQPAAAAGRR